MLDFRINTFLTVCKYMNFTRAAQELNITQPAVSQHIRYLEDAYQVKLFDYKNKNSCVILNFFVSKTTFYMIIYNSCGL